VFGHRELNIGTVMASRIPRVTPPSTNSSNLLRIATDLIDVFAFAQF
jgi:hypothetical protein